MKATFICLAIFILSVSALHDGLYKVTPKATTDEKCCLIVSPVYIESSFDQTGIYGLFSNSKSCKAANLSGHFVDHLVIGNARANRGRFHKFDVVSIDNTTGTLVSKSVNASNCSADLTLDPTPVDFSGKWTVTPNNKSNASCCFLTGFTVTPKDSQIFISGTWPNSPGCQNISFKGDFNKNATVQRFTTLALTFPEIGPTAPKLYLERWNTFMFYDVVGHQSHACRAIARKAA